MQRKIDYSAFMSLQAFSNQIKAYFVPSADQGAAKVHVEVRVKEETLVNKQCILADPEFMQVPGALHHFPHKFIRLLSLSFSQFINLFIDYCIMKAIITIIVYVLTIIIIINLINYYYNEYYY